jgi:hypothetical protein
VLLRQPYVFDIVVSDFGRESSIEFVRSAAILERRVARSFLSGPDEPFFDEYRRLMFVLVGDLAYFKSTQIAAYLDSGVLDRNILVGISDTSIPPDLIARIEESVLFQLEYALSRGYRHIRVVIPCNTLAPASASLQRLFGNRQELFARVYATEGCRPASVDPASVQTAQLEVLTVPAVVLDYIDEVRPEGAGLLVLGTPATVTLYRQELANRASEARHSIVSLNSAEQQLINDAVVASIDGDSSVVRQLRQRIESDVVAVRRGRSEDLVVIEACTDFDLGLGLGSRTLFMARLVSDAYGIPVVRSGLVP